MDLTLTEEQQLLQSSARDFLRQECPTTHVRAMEEDEIGYSPQLWKQMAELGWIGLMFPEAYGGSGYSFLELCVLMEEFGRALLPSPFHSTVLTFGLPLLFAGSEAQKRRYLPAIAAGNLLGTLALTEPSATYTPEGITTRATPQGGGFVLNGTKLFVLNAHTADELLVAARTRDAEPGISLLLVPRQTPGITVTPLATIASDRQFEVEFRNVEVGADALLGPLHEGWPIVRKTLDYATVATCAELVGIAQVAFDMSVEYAKSRVQFGRPIGSFQAIKHKCADMVVDVDGSRFITYRAAWCLAKGLDATKEIAMAKAWTSDACRRVCASAHQIHGGIGFTKEYDLQLYFRRAKRGEVLYGDADVHREVVAQEIGL
ncbi:MAG: acyl-CoA dehydrogenase [Candidatus Tectimicrobiota bacterium]|nr:MAG: acyl-CoA dehydrogenase [Candidatus Tectomicrobia bacterium]